MNPISFDSALALVLVRAQIGRSTIQRFKRILEVFLSSKVPVNMVWPGDDHQTRRSPSFAIIPSLASYVTWVKSFNI